jgi:hypothetical protein
MDACPDGTILELNNCRDPYSASVTFFGYGSPVGFMSS